MRMFFGRITGLKVFHIPNGNLPIENGKTQNLLKVETMSM
jgi:hypothetical protein